MKNKYIADIIPQKEIAKWKSGNKVFITSQTGSGKSEFIKTNLYQYCKLHNKKILLLSNRILLKNQNEENLGDKLDVITLKNYQSLENSVLNGKENIFSRFDYVCFDEVHYLLSDSAFNSNTDILLKKLKFTDKEDSDKIFIFLTATPQAIFRYRKQNEFDFIYTLDADYSYIEKIYFYRKNETVENVLSAIPPDEKCIYFGTALDAFVFSSENADSKFICSNNNREFKRKSDNKTMDEIVETDNFSSRFLFSTKVLDNGVNLFSPKLKHIIIDMLDPIDLIQCLGRKRISNENEKIVLYIKNQNGNDIFPIMKTIKNRLALVEELKTIGKEEFQNKYARKQIDNIIMTNGEINYAKFYYSKYLEDTLPKMYHGNYQEMISRFFINCGVNKKDILIAEQYFEKIELSAVLESYVGKKLFKEEQEEFKKMFFDNIFKIKRNIDIRNRGLKSINSILEEDNLPFSLRSGRETGGKNRRNTYWILLIAPDKIE